MLIAQIQSATQWQLDVHWTWAPWVTTLVIASLVALVVWIYRTEVSPAGHWYRGLLGLLRLTSLGIVLLMLSELVLSTTKRGEPRLAILIDRSPSMAEDDANVDGSKTTRLAAAKQFLTSGDGQRIRTLDERYELSIAAIASEIDPLATSQDLAIEIDALSLADDGTRTRLGDALTAMASPGDSASPTAVIAFTDGRATVGRSVEQAAAIARRRGVPLYLVGIGSDEAKPDVALSEVISDQVVFADDLATVEATIEATNLAGRTLQVKLIDIATGDSLSNKVVAISDATFREKITLVFEPKVAGDLNARLEVTPLAEEEAKDNNAAEFTVRVTDEPVKVLLAAGYPCYEFRYLKSVLDRDTKFKTATYLQEADLDYARQDRTAIAQLPLSEEQFAEFDVIVLIDLDPSLLPPLVWQSLEMMVGERGGGLLLVSGTRNFPWDYRQNENIARLAPIEITGSGGGSIVDEGFRPQWTDLAEQMANLQLAPTREESNVIWARLAPQYWFAEVGPAKPAAQVLAVHPNKQMNDGAAIPIVATQYYGAGRVWYHAIDSTWRWRLRVGDVFFARYWGQTLRMLARGKMLEDAAGARLEVERNEYEPGEVVRLALQAAGTSARALTGDSAVVSIESPGQANRQITLERQAASGRFTAELRDLAPGSYRGFLVEPSLNPAPAAIEFRIVAPPGEFSDTTLNRAALRAAAATTLGEYYDIADADSLLADLPAGEAIAREAAPPVELWNKWWMLALLTACLSTEWILRKKKAML